MKQSEIQYFILLRSEGYSLRQIAEKMGKSTHTMCMWNKKFSFEIISTRNKQFCELQKKIIDDKTSRLVILKSELDKITKILQKKTIKNDSFVNYNTILDLYTKLSGIISNSEMEVLKVGINYKDNIQPESDIDLVKNNQYDDDDEVIIEKDSKEQEKNCNNPVDEKGEKVEKKDEIEETEQQNCNDLQQTTSVHEKFDNYRKMKNSSQSM